MIAVKVKFFPSYRSSMRCGKWDAKQSSGLMQVVDRSEGLRAPSGRLKLLFLEYTTHNFKGGQVIVPILPRWRYPSKSKHLPKLVYEPFRTPSYTLPANAMLTSFEKTFDFFCDFAFGYALPQQHPIWITAPCRLHRQLFSVSEIRTKRVRCEISLKLCMLSRDSGALPPMPS